MCGSLCDAALETEDSGSRLESMHESNLFLVPLDDHGEWYRYHHLLEDLLRQTSPSGKASRSSRLNRRAADSV
jgi:LuxR family maltose regulon positive regulatory protein